MNFQNIFLIRDFWFRYIFPIKYKIRFIDLMLLPKNSVPFEGLYYSSMKYMKSEIIAADLGLQRCI